MFYFAERYGEETFDEPIADNVPAFADLPEWQGYTFSHTLNMVTGVRAGEDPLSEPLELAPDRKPRSTTSPSSGISRRRPERSPTTPPRTPSCCRTRSRTT